MTDRPTVIKLERLIASGDAAAIDALLARLKVAREGLPRHAIARWESSMDDLPMGAVEVYVTENHMRVGITVSWTSVTPCWRFQDSSHVTLHPDQIETVIGRLRDAKAEVLRLRQEQQSTPPA